MRSTGTIVLSLLLGVGLTTSAQATSTVYLIADALSSASVTVALQGVAIGSGDIDITGSFVTFDGIAPSLDDLEFTGTSINTIVLSEAVNVGLGAISQIFINSATLVDDGPFAASTLVAGNPAVFASAGPIEVSSNLSTDLGPQVFGFDDTLEAIPIIITQDALGITLELSGFTLASFDVFEAGGNVIPDGLTIKLDVAIVAAPTPIPEPGASVLFFASLILVWPFVRQARRSGSGRPGVSVGA